MFHYYLVTNSANLCSQINLIHWIQTKWLYGFSYAQGESAFDWRPHVEPESHRAIDNKMTSWSYGIET